MCLVVLESPFAGDRLKNVLYAQLCMRHAIKLGESPIASHLLYTQNYILDDNKQSERQLGIDMGFEWGVYADKIVVYTDLGVSSGMKNAIDFYSALGMPIEYRQISKTKLFKQLIGDLFNE